MEGPPALLSWRVLVRRIPQEGRSPFIIEISTIDRSVPYPPIVMEIDDADTLQIVLAGVGVTHEIRQAPWSSMEPLSFTTVPANVGRTVAGLGSNGAVMLLCGSHSVDAMNVAADAAATLCGVHRRI